MPSGLGMTLIQRFIVRTTTSIIDSKRSGPNTKISFLVCNQPITFIVKITAPISIPNGTVRLVNVVTNIQIAEQSFVGDGNSIKYVEITLLSGFNTDFDPFQIKAIYDGHVATPPNISLEQSESPIFYQAVKSDGKISGYLQIGTVTDTLTNATFTSQSYLFDYNVSATLNHGESGFPLFTTIYDWGGTGNPIEVFTVGEHFLQIGQTVRIRGASNNTEINGFHKIDSLNFTPSSFRLTGTVNSGTAAPIHITDVIMYESPLVVTTEINHGFVTGDSVDVIWNVSYATGDDTPLIQITFVTGKWTITVTAPNKFYLNGSSKQIYETFYPDAIQNNNVKAGVSGPISNTDINDGYMNFYAIRKLKIVTALKTNPIQINTATKHNLHTGDLVTIYGVVGNTNANGIWNITKLDDNNFTLKGSEANGHPQIDTGNIETIFLISHDNPLINNVSTGISDGYDGVFMAWPVNDSGSVTDTYGVEAAYYPSSTCLANVHSPYSYDSAYSHVSIGGVVSEMTLTASPYVVVNATSTTPIEITSGKYNGPDLPPTVIRHGLGSNETVVISGVLGNENANGAWKITVTGPTTFKLIGSVSSGIADVSGITSIQTTIETNVHIATNASPIKITTTNLHKLITGSTVSISGVVGNTAANIESAIVTVIDEFNFTLNGTVGNGNHTTDTGTILSNKILLGVYFSPTTDSFSNFHVTNTTGAGVPITVSTETPHNLLDGDRITISGVVGNTNANVDEKEIKVIRRKTIISATNTTPIIIKTATVDLTAHTSVTDPHNLVTGDSVIITGVLGNLNANGIWIITKIGIDTFSLNNSVGSGTYSGPDFVIINDSPIFISGIVILNKINQFLILPETIHGNFQFLEVLFSVGAVRSAKIAGSVSISTIAPSPVIQNLLSGDIINNTVYKAYSTLSAIGTFNVQVNYIPPSHKTITTITGSNPITVTAANHGLFAENLINIFGVIGDASLNGTFTIKEKIDNNKFTIATSGSYISGGVVSVPVASISKTITVVSK